MCDGVCALPRQLREASAVCARAADDFSGFRDSQVPPCRRLLRKLAPYIRMPDAPPVIESGLAQVLYYGWGRVHWARNYSLLHYAAETLKDPQIVELIALLCEDVDAPDARGMRAIDYARSNSCPGVARVIEKARQEQQKSQKLVAAARERDGCYHAPEPEGEGVGDPHGGLQPAPVAQPEEEEGAPGRSAEQSLKSRSSRRHSAPGHLHEASPPKRRSYPMLLGAGQAVPQAGKADDKDEGAPPRPGAPPSPRPRPRRQAEAGALDANDHSDRVEDPHLCGSSDGLDRRGFYVGRDSSKAAVMPWGEESRTGDSSDQD